MQKNKDLQLTPGQEIQLTVMNEGGRRAAATLTGKQNCRLTLDCDIPVSTDSPIRIDMDDSLILAQISDCRAFGSRFVLEAEVMHAIPSLTGLSKLVSAVMYQGRGPAPERETQGFRSQQFMPSFA